jgi:hypothetical protein
MQAIRASGYTIHSIGPNQELTPEGFLLCKDVPVARTGMMLYGPDETPIEAGADGIARIYRDADELFNALTIASAVGKSITNNHPEDGADVEPENWSELTVGIALNVRRGSGAEDDLLLMDLLFTTKEGIGLVKSEKWEISLGYDADYVQIEAGKGKQSNMIVNHIALVESGRCGQRCTIKDKQFDNTEAKKMADRYGKKKTKDKQGLSKVISFMFRANKARDAEELAEIINEAVEDEEFTAVENQPVKDDMEDLGADKAENGDTHIHIHNGAKEESAAIGDEKEVAEGRATFSDGDIQEHIDTNAKEHNDMRARLAAIEAKLGLTGGAAEGDDVLDGNEELEEFMKDEAPEGIPEEEVVKARDSRYLGESMKDTIAMAEILAPGIRVPTYDRKANPAKTAKTICALRRKALDQAFAAPADSLIIKDILGSRALDTKNMSCSAVRTLFRSAASVKRQSNNSLGVRDSIVNLQAAQNTKQGAISTIEQINQANADYYSSKK